MPPECFIALVLAGGFVSLTVIGIAIKRKFEELTFVLLQNNKQLDSIATEIARNHN